MRCEQCHNQICMYRRTAGECVFDGQTSEIHITPNSGFFPFEKDYPPSGIQDPIKKAALALVDAVERYVAPKPGDKYCSRTEILNAKDNLKKLISNE